MKCSFNTELFSLCTINVFLYDISFAVRWCVHFSATC